MNSKTQKRILIFIAALVILYLVIYVVPKVTGALRSTYTVEYGMLRTGDEATGYIVRSESVYVAVNGGDENKYIEDGKLIRKGTAVLAVEGDTQANQNSKFSSLLKRLGDAVVESEGYTAVSEGIVCYYADGYEAELTPETMSEKDEKFFKKLSKAENIELERTKVAKGDPLFKIVDRAKWYIVCFVPESSAERYTENKKVKVEFENGASIEGRVYSIDESGDTRKLIIATNYYYENFARERVAQVNVITSERRGLIIENSSIAELDGQPGVYVQQKTGEYKFTRINILSTDGKRSVVSRSYFYDAEGEMVYTLKNYDEVLKRGV